MNAKLFPILILLVGLFSCNEDELSPEAKVQGTYELIYQDNEAWSDELFDYVNTFELRSDGTFYRADVTKNLGSDEVLGYRSYGSGTYTITDGEVTFVYQDLYTMGTEDINYLPKDQLTLLELEGYLDYYRILSDYKKLEYICPPNANCGDLPIYSKIE